jgi:hypothetical protein
MREKFGEKVKLVPVEAERKIPFPFSLLGNMNLSDDLADTLDQRAIRGRYGL